VESPNQGLSPLSSITYRRGAGRASFLSTTTTKNHHMNPTGKRARKAKGLTRAEIKHGNHTPKSEAKIARMGWKRDKTKSTNYRHTQNAK
jgi:hypothetical protein